MIVQEVGDAPDGRVQANVAGIWGDSAEKARINPWLQVLYTKRRCIKLLQGSVRDQVSVTTLGDGERLTDLINNLVAMGKEVDAEILAIEKKARSGRGGASMAIAATAPVAPPLPCPYPDANSPAYSGSPYVRNWPDGRLP